MKPSVSPTKEVIITFEASFELGVPVPVDSSSGIFTDPAVTAAVGEAIAATMAGVDPDDVDVIEVCPVPPGCDAGARATVLVEVFPTHDDAHTAQLFMDINKAQPVQLMDLPLGGVDRAAHRAAGHDLHLLPPSASSK